MSATIGSVALADVAELNPRLADSIQPTTQVSFVPMAAVTEVTGEIVREEMRPYAEVAKGFTPFKSGDIIVAKITPCFQNGKIAHAKLSQPWGFGSTEFHVVRADAKRLFPRYIFHFLRQDYIRVAGERRMTGSAGQRRVPQNYLAHLQIPLPPLSEQKRMAEILDGAEALRAKRRAALALLDELTQSIFLDMFGDPERNPKGWERRPFADICDSRLGKMLDGKQLTGKFLRPYLRNANVQWFRFELDEVFEMDFDSKAQEMFRLKYGDLLICEGGEPGRAAIWRNEIEECYYQKALHCARPRNEVANAEYLAWQLWFLAKRGGLGDHVTAATIAHLTGEKLKAMKVCIPPISIQNEFAARLLGIENIRIPLLAAEKSVAQLFASLQHRAFRGEL